MKEYIEKAEAINAIRQYQYPYGVEFLLANIPAADVVDVRHGRWENNCPDDIVVYCSQCMMPQDAPSNYCPSCGALMDKEDEHDKHSSNPV